MEMKMIKERFHDFSRKDGTKSVYASVISIFIGLFIGFLTMVVCSFAPNANGDPFSGLLYLFAGPFSSSIQPLKELGMMLFYAGPLIFTGLSIAVAYKTGLFNIGAPGQFLMGTMGSLLIALNINTTGNRMAGVLVWLLALFVGILLGALWSLIPGLLKAFFGINEVIICIMSNWIAANIVSWVFSLPSLAHLSNNAAMKSGYLIQTSLTGNYTPTLGLGDLFSSNGSPSYLDIGLILAILVAALMWIVMSKTALGYELKACGYNKDAARYAGMNEKFNIAVAMALAGGLAAAGGALYYLNPNIELQYQSCYQILPEYGFNGIPVVLLANSHPIGVIFSSVYVRYLNSAGGFLQRAGYNKYFADIIIAVIIYLTGLSRFIQEQLTRYYKANDKRGSLFLPYYLKKLIHKFRAKTNQNTKTEVVELKQIETPKIVDKASETISKPVMKKKIVRIKKVTTKASSSSRIQKKESTHKERK